jgi:hypothetical protein
MYKLFIFLEITPIPIQPIEDNNIEETFEEQFNQMGIYIGIILLIVFILLYLSILSIAKLNAIKRKLNKLEQSIQNKSEDNRGNYL